MTTNTRHFDTIVIGAGISGLACAARLFQHRARHGSVKLLEARDRIGGRINSVNLNGHRLDTGANWIHGTGTEEKPNPLMDILPHKRYRQLKGVVAFNPPKENRTSSASKKNSTGDDWEDIGDARNDASNDGNAGKDLVIPSKYAGTLMGSVWRAIGNLHETAATTPANEAKTTTLLSAVSKSETLQDAFKALPAEYHPALSGLPQFLEGMEAGALTAQSAEHDQDIPGMSLLEYAIEDFDGDQVYLQDGYTAVINELAKDILKAGVVETGVEVETINWEENPITITTSRGTYSANRVVCTIPLGVLQQKATTLFQPALPKAKAEAINSLGFGTLDKIFMLYTHPWWTEEPYASIFQKGYSPGPFASDAASGQPSSVPDSFWGFTHQLPGLSISATGVVTFGPRLLSLINLHALTGVPALSCFISCANAVHIESQSDAYAQKLVHDSLTSWLGVSPPRPEAVHVTRWSKDEFSRGSYSHMVAGLSETGHRVELQKVVAVSKGYELRFAGEHTSRNHFATAHGALISGWREADAILESSVKTDG